MADLEVRPPSRPGDSIQFVGGQSGMGIQLVSRDDGYVSVTSPDDPTLSGVLWETIRDWGTVEDSYELSAPPRLGDSGAFWRDILNRF